MIGIESPVEVKIFGPDVAKLRELAEPIGKIVEDAGLEEVDTHVRLGNPDLVVRPNRVALARLGLTEQDVENQLNAALYGQVATTLPEQDRITDIRVRYPDRVRFDRNRLEQLPIALPPAADSKTAAPGDFAARLRHAGPGGDDPTQAQSRMPCGARTSSR